MQLTWQMSVCPRRAGSRQNAQEELAGNSLPEEPSFSAFLFSSYYKWYFIILLVILSSLHTSHHSDTCFCLGTNFKLIWDHSEDQIQIPLMSMRIPQLAESILLLDGTLSYCPYLCISSCSYLRADRFKNKHHSCHRADASPSSESH